MRKILSTHPLHPRAIAMLAGAGKLAVASALDAKTLTAEARDVDIVIVRAPLPPELFDGASNLRAAIRHGAGLDMIPVEAATAAGVLVAN
ncbi:MAG: dehydrogenase, partial [Mesorhizobium sp.]